MDSYIINNQKSQDYACEGNSITNYSNEPFQYRATFDGFGTNTIIDYIRSLDMNIIFSYKYPWEIIISLIDLNISYKHQFKSGASFALIRIFKNRIETINIGNSRIMIIKNGMIDYFSNKHNFDNILEKIRLNNKFNKFIVEDKIFRLVNVEELASISARKILINNNYLDVTQFLGYNGISGYKPDIYINEFKYKDKIVAITATDGFWDVILPFHDLDFLIYLNARRLANLSNYRWYQPWLLKKKINGINQLLDCKINYPDDIAISIWKNC